MGPPSDMVLAASPAVARKDSSVIGVRAKPITAYRAPREWCDARSNKAGMTLRLARSPEAPKRTTAHGSVAARKERFAESGSAAMEHLEGTGTLHHAVETANAQRTIP